MLKQKSVNDIKITVLMPVYNAAGYVADAIHSVLAQTFSDFELLIIDDGSTDDTAAIIQSFNDKRIVVINQENQGVAGALNTGLKHARATFIARFDADDICFPQRLEKQYEFLKANPAYMIVGAAVDYMDATGNYIFTYDPPYKTNDELLLMPYNICPFIHSSVMYKKDVVASIGYNVHAHSFEDHLLWQKIHDSGKMYNLSESLVKVRLNPTSFTMDERKRPVAFHAIKEKALKTGEINQEEGEKLLKLIREQNNSNSKKGAYYNLLAKKFLWNNYQPQKARANIRKALRINFLDMHGYFLFILSYMPQNFIANIYSKFGSSK
ncbi:MAG: glycosyltransferase [Ferruginibacter sp.]